MAKEKELLEKISGLESELAKKDQDLRIYRQELINANEKLKGLIAQVDDQLRQAHRIQKMMVPTEFPNIPGFEFSTKFKASAFSGGDYFDIFEHHDKMRFGLFMSSASGYGMSSLFLSILMKMTFEIEDRRSRDPAFVMKEIVEELRQEARAEDQSAIFYGVFDRRKFQLTYSNFGQTLCIYHQASTDKMELLGGHPEPFNQSSQGFEKNIGNLTIDLEPNDKLIFCSNGFLGLKNPEGLSWGIQEILSIIKRHAQKDVHELRNEMFYQAQQFSKELTKDLTVIVVEVKERIIKLASDHS